MPVNLNDPTIYNNNVNKPTDGEKLRTDLTTIINFVNDQEAILNTFFSAGINTTTATRALNADAVSIAGLYYTDSTSTGTPITAYNTGYLLHMAGSAGPSAQQLWLSPAGNYVRTETASVWSSWKTINTPLNYVSVPTATYATATTFTMNGNAVATSGDGLYFLSVTGNKTIDITTTNVLNGRANGVALTANTSYYLYMVQSADASTNGYILDTAQNLTTHTIASVVYRSRQLKVLVRTDNSSNLIQGYFTDYDFDRGRFSLTAFATVNFDGTTAANLTGTFTRTGSTVTVTVTGHGHIAGHRIYFVGTGITSGFYTVATVIDANNFTFTSGTGTITSTACTLQRRSIRKAVNVQSVAYSTQGNYAVNFTTLAPDANYCVATSHNTAFGAGPTLIMDWDVAVGAVASTTAYFHFNIDFYGIGSRDTTINKIQVFA